MNRKKLAMKREVVHVLTSDLLGVAGGVTTQPPPSLRAHCTFTLRGGGVCAPDTQNECP